MAIANAALTLLLDESSGTSFATSSITPTGDALVLATIVTSHSTTASNPSSVTGNGLTWVLIDSQAFISASIIGMVSVYRAMGASPTSGVVTANFAASQDGCVISVSEYTGTDTTGTNGSGAIVQSITNAANTDSLVNNLATFGDTNNVGYATCGMDLNEAPVVPTSFTTIHADAIESPAEIALHTATGPTNDNTITWTTTGDAQGLSSVNIEIKVGGATAITGTLNTTDVDDTLAGVGTLNVLSALDFGTDNNSRYFDVDVTTNSLVLPDGDWCVGMWVRMPNGLLTTMDYQYIFSGGTIGAANSFHVFFGESGSNFRDIVVRFRGATGTEVNQLVVAGVGNVTTGIDNDDHLLVIQRIGTTVYGYWILEGDTVSTSDSSFSNNSNTANTFQSLNIARRPDGNATRYFGNTVGEVFIIANDSLTNTELTTLAAGTHITTVRTSPELDLRFRGSNATELDVSGNGFDATRFGTGYTLLEEFFPDPSGVLDTTDVDDTIAASGIQTEGNTGTINVTDVDDTSNTAGTQTYLGTLNTTDVNDTIAATGTHTEIVTGTLNTTDVDDTSTTAGGQTFTGTINTTDVDDTIAATGAEIFSGTLNTTDEDDTTTTAGTQTYLGTLDVTDVDDITASAGTQTYLGTLDVTDVDDTISASGLEAFIGILNTTDVDDTIVAIGIETILGTINVTDIDDTTDTAGTQTYLGTSDTTDADDTSDTAAEVVFTGISNTTDVDDTIASIGIMQPSGTIDVTDVDDTIAATGVHSEENTLNTTDEDDTPTMVGIQIFIATSDTTDIDDTSSIAAEVVFTGTSNTTDVDDIISASGLEAFIGILNTTDVDDTTASAGTQTYLGTSDTTDVDDTINASGIQTENPVGTLNTTDVDDISTGIGEQIFAGIADTTDVDDTIIAAGLQTITGTVNTTDNDDTTTSNGIITYLGILNVTEEDDIIAGVGEIGNGVLGTLNTTDVDDTTTTIGLVIPLYSTTVEDITFIIDESTDTNVSNFNIINNLFVEDTSIVVKQQAYTNILEECIQGPVGPPGSQGITEADLTYAKRVDFTVNETIIYKGEAEAGSLENIAVWRVRRLTIANDNDVIEEWADGVDTFDKIWANRLSITYS